MATEKKAYANVFDVDGTLAERPGLLQGWQAWRVKKFGPQELKSLLKRYKSISDIPVYAQIAADRGIIWPMERASLFFHASRPLIPAIIGIARSDHADGTDIYITTGRHHHEEWIRTTKNTLSKNGTEKDIFTEMFFKRKGAESALSKAIVIKMLLYKYEKIRFFEDDVETAIFIARIFGSAVEIRLIFHEQYEQLYEKLDIKQYSNIQLQKWKIAKIF